MKKKTTFYAQTINTCILKLFRNAVIYFQRIPDQYVLLIIDLLSDEQYFSDSKITYSNDFCLWFPISSNIILNFGTQRIIDKEQR